jgi:hypothetical protein
MREHRCGHPHAHLIECPNEHPVVLLLRSSDAPSVRWSDLRFLSKVAVKIASARSHLVVLDHSCRSVARRPPTRVCRTRRTTRRSAAVASCSLDRCKADFRDPPADDTIARELEAMRRAIGIRARCDVRIVRVRKLPPRVVSSMAMQWRLGFGVRTCPQSILCSDSIRISRS